MAESHKLKAAEASTDAVQDTIGKVLEILNTDFNGRIVNGYGIYSDPGRQARALRSARALLDQAQALMEEARWPTNADYDAAERRE